MIMMPYAWLWSSLQLKGHADFWHPTPAIIASAGGSAALPVARTGRTRDTIPGMPGNPELAAVTPTQQRHGPDGPLQRQC